MSDPVQIALLSRRGCSGESRGLVNGQSPGRNCFGKVIVGSHLNRARSPVLVTARSTVVRPWFRISSPASTSVSPGIIFVSHYAIGLWTVTSLVPSGKVASISTHPLLPVFLQVSYSSPVTLSDCGRLPAWSRPGRWLQPELREAVPVCPPSRHPG